MITIIIKSQIKEWFCTGLIVGAALFLSLLLSILTALLAMNHGSPARHYSKNDNIIIVSRPGNQDQHKMLEKRLRILQEQGVHSGSAEIPRAANLRGMK